MSSCSEKEQCTKPDKKKQNQLSHLKVERLQPCKVGYVDVILSNGVNNRPLSILELGSGTGTVEIVIAATLGANVTLTDLLHVVPNLQFNAEANASIIASNYGAVDVAPLRWVSFF